MDREALLEAPVQPHIANTTAANNGSMDASMDIDMDLDLGQFPEPDPIELEPATTLNVAAAIAGKPEVEAVSPNEEPQLEKVHIRGVDELTTDDIKRFAFEYFTLEEPQRIEWIDDTSANIVYSSAEIGAKALSALTQENVEDAEPSSPSLRLRTAKALSSHPDSVLQVRLAVKSDRKKHRAHEASRFYLMHPEHDPRERMRSEFSGRRRRGSRGDSDGDYRRKRFDDREHRRRRGQAKEDRFDVSMYDDDGDRGRRGSSGDISSADSHSRSRARRNNRDLFSDRMETSEGRLRDRSASPSRANGDGPDLRLAGGSSSSRRFRDRPPLSSHDRRDRSRSNVGKELYPSGNNSSDDTSRGRELFPNKTASSYLKKELLLNSVTPPANTIHRRSDAFDAADETTELLAQRMTVPFVDGASDGPQRSGSRKVELFPDSAGHDRQSLKIRGISSENSGMSIRGNASGGISIKGAAAVRELFPSKYSSNEGKELFSDAIEGRGGKRRRAEDMFS
ncbi:uncharacterized protein GIQ15_03461 [Arthroderma uncinatum]|uniref:uncharacterized protein n=1 Tax=Arthroderma uncinatum TaxID=74035 RepID=UPI00144ACC71|nr:uncharacterized protein GIQ15_03461 [Arthroderma uncinatum]KAF3484137.1 hypothetical protein GIQ15_03461 [Arthroderma uncinatum]